MVVCHVAVIRAITNISQETGSSDYITWSNLSVEMKQKLGCFYDNRLESCMDSIRFNSNSNRKTNNVQ